MLSFKNLFMASLRCIFPYLVLAFHHFGFCCHKKQIDISFLCICPLINDKLRQNIAKVYCETTCLWLVVSQPLTMLWPYKKTDKKTDLKLLNGKCVIFFGYFLFFYFILVWGVFNETIWFPHTCWIWDGNTQLGTACLIGYLTSCTHSLLNI